jgi:endoglucanase
MSAVAGKPNALPYSDTTDDRSLTQRSDAYLYHRVSTPVTDQTLSYTFNGNTLSSVNAPNGNALVKGTDYTVSGPNITYKASLLSKYITSTSASGPAANFTLKWSKGAALTANLVQWDVATLGSKGSSAKAAAATGGDLAIPVTWKGINKPAAVQATLPDGTCLFDTWTIYLPPLQQCRMVSMSPGLVRK